MPAMLHHYPVKVHWKGGRDGSGSVNPAGSGTTIAVAVPPEFNGPGGETNPEELLTSAITACYSITFGIVAANRKLPVARIEVDAEGTVEQIGASFVYKEVVIRPTIFVSADTTDELMAATTEMAHKADQYCIVTNAVRGKVDVRVEPTVVRE